MFLNININERMRQHSQQACRWPLSWEEFLIELLYGFAALQRCLQRLEKKAEEFGHKVQQVLHLEWNNQRSHCRLEADLLKFSLVPWCLPCQPGGSSIPSWQSKWSVWQEASGLKWANSGACRGDEGETNKSLKKEKHGYRSQLLLRYFRLSVLFKMPGQNLWVWVLEFMCTDFHYPWSQDESLLIIFPILNICLVIFSSVL